MSKQQLKGQTVLQQQRSEAGTATLWSALQQQYKHL
jgi:hypothetical protein